MEAREVLPTPITDSADEVLASLVDVAKAVIARATSPPVACGVGCGGPMAGGLVSPLNIPAWRAFPLAGALADALAIPVAVDNDAKALALAEGWLGAACGVRDYLAMVVSTGIGGGVVVDGRLLDGRLGNAGHVGHVNVEPEGRPCVCGSHGCLEAEAAGPAIEARTGRSASEAPLAERVRAGTLVGRAVASVACLLDLDLVVVGGSVALGFGTPYFAAAQEELGARARIAFARGCRVVPVGLGELAPLIGAAVVALRVRDEAHVG